MYWFKTWGEGGTGVVYCQFYRTSERIVERALSSVNRLVITAWCIVRQRGDIHFTGAVCREILELVSVIISSGDRWNFA